MNGCNEAAEPTCEDDDATVSGFYGAGCAAMASYDLCHQLMPNGQGIIADFCGCSCGDGSSDDQSEGDGSSDAESSEDESDDDEPETVDTDAPEDTDAPADSGDYTCGSTMEECEAAYETAMKPAVEVMIPTMTYDSCESADGWWVS